MRCAVSLTRGTGVRFMSVNTSNAYGKITISDMAIAKVASQAAMECYGIVETVSRRFTDSNGDRIYIDVYVIIKFGVSINAVAESLKESVKYRVEKFTGMIVDTVNVNVIGVKL